MTHSRYIWTKLILPILISVAFPVIIHGQPDALDQYNITWKSQSKNAGESMPCGGGDIGLNVWVEDGALLFYFSRSGTFDVNNTFLKLGRVRMELTPNPFDGSSFTQELVLRDGYVRIAGVTGTHTAEVQVWVDVFRPVIHVEINSNKTVKAEAFFESWRYKDRLLQGKENNANAYKWAPQGEIKTSKDEIDFQKKDVRFYHRNEGISVFDVTVKQQGLDSVKQHMFDPLKNLTFGGIIRGENMVPAGTASGRYLDTDHTAWKLQSISPARSHHLTLYLHTAQSETVEAWNDGLQKVIDDAALYTKTAKKKTREWWNKFWDRSFVFIESDQARPHAPEWQAGRNYQLFRYMLGCNAFGDYPTKFNGGLFTYDPRLTDSTLRFTPDHRNWGGGTMTAQNQRLVYFPMLKSGDIELMKPQFDFYLRAQRNAELRSQVYWGHDGACFTEQLENFGLPNCSEYGWNRPKEFDKGVEYNAWLEYQWDTVLEFCLMMLETERYAGKDITPYIPFIESCLTFFNEHYQYRSRMRGRKTFDGNGHLILYPGSAAETFKMAYNATPTVAALQTLLSRLLALPQNYLAAQKRGVWETMLMRIPPISFGEFDGHKTIGPAKHWERINNVETPQLYPLFPWRMYGIGKPDLTIAINTWNYDSNAVKFRSHVGWKQDNIFAACMGLTKEAAELTLLKLKDSGRRFPAFWGPGFDWTPDHNWGGSGMIGLQEMLLQADGNKLYLFPAWPREWDVHFKLHAPYNTIVEGSLKDGTLKSLKVSPESRRKDVINLLELIP